MLKPAHSNHHHRRPLIGNPILRGPILGPFGQHRTHMFITGPAMILLYESTVFKLHVDDVSRIQRDTRRLIVELDVDELRAALKRLSIDQLELAHDDHAEIERARRWD